MADDKVLLSVEFDPSGIEEQLAALESRKPGAGGPSGAGRAPPPTRESPASAISDMHKTLKRMFAVTVLQTNFQIRSGSIVQTSLQALSSAVKAASNVAIVTGGPIGIALGIAGRIAAATGDSLNTLADMGKGFITQAARFNPKVMAAMAKRNVAELMSEIQLSKNLGPKAIMALQSERELFQDPNRMKALTTLRGAAMTATRSSFDLERIAYRSMNKAVESFSSIGMTFDAAKVALDVFVMKVRDSSSSITDFAWKLKDMLGWVNMGAGYGSANIRMNRPGYVPGAQSMQPSFPNSMGAGQQGEFVGPPAPSFDWSGTVKSLMNRVTSLIPKESEDAWKHGIESAEIMQGYKEAEEEYKKSGVLQFPQ